ncbi:MAG: hypothetical protein ACUVR4_09795 [Anaerolineae bacterium]
MWSYLVHFGDWTKPGQHPQSQYLLPPEALRQGDMSWVTLLAAEEQIAVKATALNRHATQLSFRNAYLKSFVRPNELFAQVTPIQLSAPLFEWQGVEFRPFFGLPKASLLKRFAPGLYLTQFDLIEEGGDILVSVATERALSARQTLVVWLYPRRRSAAFALAPQVELVLSHTGLLKAQDLRNGAPCDAVVLRKGDHMLVRINQAALDEPDALFLAASMRANGITLDHTGWRLVYLEPQPEDVLEQIPQDGALHAWERQEDDSDGDQAIPGE